MIRAEHGIITGVKLGVGGAEAPKRDGAREESIHPALNAVQVNIGVQVKVNHLTRGVYARVRTSGTHQLHLRPEYGCECGLQALLNGGGPRLALPSVPPRSVILDRRAISPH